MNQLNEPHHKRTHPMDTDYGDQNGSSQPKKQVLSESEKLLTNNHKDLHLEKENDEINNKRNSGTRMKLANVPDVIVAVHFITSGLQGDEIGTDEAPLISISLAAVNLNTKTIQQCCSWKVNPLIGNENFEQTDNNNGNLTLSSEVTAMTGWTITDLQDGLTLEEVLQQMDTFLKENFAYSNQTYQLAAFGQLPFRLVLHPEASTKNINIRSYSNLFTFFDLKKAYESILFSGSTTTPTEKMTWKTFIENFSLTDQTTSFDDCTNYDRVEAYQMAELILELQKKGWIFDEVELVDKFYYPALIKKSDHIEDDVIVRARGLPWQATDCDIQKFFRGLNIAPGGIALVLSKVGRRNGEALIRFASSEHRDIALKKHKHHMNQRYIEVYIATARDFLLVAGGDCKEAEDFLCQMTESSQTLVRMRGLPYTATAEQIMEFFENANCPIQNGSEGVLFVNHKDGRATGDAFVLFENELLAEKALQNHRQHIGSRYIELFKSTPAEVNQVMNSMQTPATNSAIAAMFPFATATPTTAAILDMETAAAAMQIQQQGMATFTMVPFISGLQNAAAAAAMTSTSGLGVSSLHAMSVGLHENLSEQVIFTQVGPATHKCFIHISGMPLETTVADIINFLGVHARHIVCQGVHLVYNSAGHPAGEAIIQLSDKFSAAIIVEQKHKTLFTLSPNGVFGVDGTSEKRSQVDVRLCTIAEASQFAIMATTPQNQMILTAANATNNANAILTARAQAMLPQMPMATAAMLSAAGGTQFAYPFTASQTTMALQNRCSFATTTGPGGLMTNSPQASLSPTTALFYAPQSNTAWNPGFTQVPISGIAAANMNNQTLGLSLFNNPLTAGALYMNPGMTNALITSSLPSLANMVVVKGLPKDVTQEELMSLFDNILMFGVYPDINLCLMADGALNGEAIVTFHTRIEAERAATECHEKTIRNHFVEILLVQPGLY